MTTEPGWSRDASFHLEFRCADCGAILQQCEGGQVKRQARQRISILHGHPHVLAIRPCRKCIAEQVAPAKAVTDAIAALMNSGEAP